MVVRGEWFTEILFTHKLGGLRHLLKKLFESAKLPRTFVSMSSVQRA